MIKIIQRLNTRYAAERKSAEEGIKELKRYGKYEYVFKSEKGEILMIQLLRCVTTHHDKNTWELYELSRNNLIDYVEKFYSKKDAIKRIKELL